jgi:ribosomal protein S18 acetylase RimI-like enzyme
MYKLSVLKQASAKDLKDLCNLMDQMSRSGHSSHRLSLAGFKGMLRDKNITVFVIRENKRIVATGTLVLVDTLIGKRARLEDVVVDINHRGKGLGKQISASILALAKKKKATSIEFTSRPSRTAAISLYEKLGFKKHEANVYRLSLK